jgi:DNA modification methylase
LKIESVKIADLVLDPSNARAHNPKNLEAIKGSLAKFGMQKPIVVGKGNVVIAGNGTLEGAKALGWTEIDVVRTKLEGPEAIAYAIADNRTGELAEWDAGVLSETLKALDAIDFDLGAIGFDKDDLESMIATPVPAEGLTDPDAVPENVETRCKPGDLWRLGEHRLLCGDSTNVQHVERLMGGEKADMLFTDPPYGIKYDESWRATAVKGYFGGSESGQLKNDDIADWTAAFVLCDVSIAYVWHASAFAHVVRQSMIDSEFDVRQQIIWRKPFGVLSRQAYNWQHEPCWYAIKKGKTALWADDNTQTTVWDVENPNHPMSKKGEGDVKTGHPTMKPVRLAEIAIKNHKISTVLDLFLGSGSTLIACEKTGRRCFGMEIDPKYCDVILARWEQFTGRQAVLSAGKAEGK